MKRIGAYYTVETTLVMGVLIFMIFSVITYTLQLYGKVERYGEKCVRECIKTEGSSETLRLERILCEVKDTVTKGEE